MAKGPSFERGICHQLDQWWTGRTDQSIFWRTAGSGARATVRARKGKKTAAHAGDICAVDAVGKPFTDVFAVELKRGYSSKTFANLLDKPVKGKIEGYEEWIGQALIARENADSFTWLLIHKRDKREPMVYMTKMVLECLKLHGAAVVHRLEFWAKIRFLPKLKRKPVYVDVVGLQFEQWLATCHPDAIRGLAKEI